MACENTEIGHNPRIDPPQRGEGVSPKEPPASLKRIGPAGVQIKTFTAYVQLGGAVIAPLGQSLDDLVNAWLSVVDVFPVSMSLTCSPSSDTVLAISLAVAYQPRQEWERQQALIRAMADTFRVANRLSLGMPEQEGEEDYGRPAEDPGAPTATSQLRDQYRTDIAHNRLSNDSPTTDDR
jgi:hypothetical protein